MVTLHDYQQTAVAAAGAELEKAGAALVVMPTGTGKSFTGVAVAKEVVARGGRVLVLSHRDFLLSQWAGACDQFDLRWGVEQAGQRAHQDTVFGRVDVVLGSKDTMKGKRLQKWRPNTFDLIIADECHRSIMPSWLKVFSHFHTARRLGLTATPERTDEESIQPVFGNCAYELKFWDAVDQGWIVPPYFHRPEAKIDLSALRMSGDDFNQGDLEDLVSKHIEVLVNLAREPIDGRQTMAFTPRVYSASAMADGFRQVGVTSCAAWGDAQDKDQTIKRFRAEEFQCLVSCDLLREGADFPSVSAGVFARPTKSGLVYRQQLGRILRRHPGKEIASIVDYSWLSDKHDLFQPIDLFDTTGMDLDVLKLAGKLLNQGERDPRKALTEAERIHKLDLAMKVQVRERTPRYKMLAYDPFQVGGLLGVPNRQREGQKPVSAANRARLGAMKLEPQGISDAQARRLLGELDARRKQDLATHRQLALLVSQGVPPEVARLLRKSDASEDLDILLGGRP